MNLPRAHKPPMDVAFQICELKSKFLICTNNGPNVLSKTHLHDNNAVWTKNLGFPKSISN